jgi:hypothetical protein
MRSGGRRISACREFQRYFYRFVLSMENRMRILLLLVGMTVSSGEDVVAENAELSASDVIAKSEAAYAAMKTYVGTTTVRSQADAGARKLDLVSTARITFMRPGKLRIEGKTGGDVAKGVRGHPFVIVSDGQATWKSWPIQNNGAFQEVQNVTTALAGKAGVAHGAADTIPAVLMKSDGTPPGGYDPFRVPRVSAPYLAGHETIDSADCYKIIVNHAEFDATLWIDSKSFVLRQMMREFNKSRMDAAKKIADEHLKKIGRPRLAPSIRSHSNVFTFVIDNVDGPVDENLFADPTKK